MAAENWPLLGSSNFDPIAGLLSSRDAPLSIETHPPPRRPDTPQLSLHGYHKFQQSPRPSSPPQLVTRRLRRKASCANLVNPSLAAATTIDSPVTVNPTPPHFCRAFNPHHLRSPSLPLPPATPQAQTATGSPSLSSTVTTLQSTPTSSPDLRGGSDIEQWRSFEGRQLVEPIRTKRKFQTLRRAKHLPRQADGSGGGPGSGGLWEVYATILDPADEEGAVGSDLLHLTFRGTEAGRQRQQTAVNERARARIPKRERTVRFDGVESLSDSAPEDKAPSEEKEATATSTFSLSKFEFPVPPGHDNWAGTLSQTSDASPSQSLATLHYHGTSFEVVNPHTSLLLGVHNFETPAERESLLDDYFSLSVLGMTDSESSTHKTRTLYDNPESARANILGMRSYMHVPPKAHIHDPPSPRKPSTNPFRNVSATNQNVAAIDEAAEGRRDDGAVEKGRREAKSLLSAPSVSTLGRKGRRHISDPFDLTLSENEAEGNAGQRGEVAPASKPIKGSRGSPASNGGGESRATLRDSDTDPVVKDIISGYEYTPLTSSPTAADLASSSSSIEQGRGEQSKTNPKPSSIPPPPPKTKEQESLTRSYEPAREALSTPAKPTPPPQAHFGGGPRFWTNCQTLRPSQTPTTSDRTYGNTDQLLNITPSSYGPKSYPWPNYEPPLYPPYTTEPHDTATVGTQHTPYGAPSFNYSVHGDVSSPSPYPKTWGMQDSANAKDPEISARNTFLSVNSPVARASSIYSVDIDGETYHADHESAWETQISESHPELLRRTQTRQTRQSLDCESYADTSAYGTQGNRNSGMSAWQEVPAPVPDTHQRNGLRITNLPDDDADLRSQANINLQAMFRGFHDEDRDTKKAMSLLSSNMSMDQLSSKEVDIDGVDKEQRGLDMKELERLRRQNPKAVRKASEQIARDAEASFKATKSNPDLKLQKKKPYRAQYNPANSFAKVASGLQVSKTRDDSYSDRGRLLATPSIPDTPKNLEYRSSQGTFATERIDCSLHPLPTREDRQWTPFTPNATARALGSRSKASAPPDFAGQAVNGRFGYEVECSSNNNNNKKKKKNKRQSRRVFTGGQTSPIELRILQPSTDRELAQEDSRPRGYLTDAQLAERASRWKSEPNLEPGGALAAYATRPEVQRNGPVEPRLPRIVTPDSFAANYWERRNFSHRVRLLCAWCPLLSLAFIYGGLNWIIRQKTNGEYTTMDEIEQSQALKTEVPFMTAFYVFLTIVLVLALAFAK